MFAFLREQIKSFQMVCWSKGENSRSLSWLKNQRLASRNSKTDFKGFEMLISRIKDLFEFDALKTRTLTHIPINLQDFSEQYNLYFLSRRNDA